MTNLGQEEIIQFSSEHKRVYQKQFDDEDLHWIQKELVGRLLEPKIIKFFSNIKSTLAALYRRFDKVIPFLPFTEEEQLVVGDTEIRSFLSRYREPPVTDEQVNLDERRILGNFLFHYTRSVVVMARSQYKPMEGASSLLKYVTNDVVSMLSEKYTTGDLKPAPPVQLGKRTVQQAWITIVDGRCDVLFKEPKEATETADTAAAKESSPKKLHKEHSEADRENEDPGTGGAAAGGKSVVEEFEGFS